MKTHIVMLAVGLVLFAGCKTAPTANTRKNRDDLARVEERAKQYEKKDGSLSGDYLADLALNGSGKKSNKPVFDQPRGN